MQSERDRNEEIHQHRDIEKKSINTTENTLIEFRQKQQENDGKASLTVIKTNEHLYGLQIDIIDNGNITSNELNKGGLHLNPRGLGKLAINFIRIIKTIAKT